MGKENFKIPVDQADRDKIVTDLDKTILVEAGAGSGKTKSLVDRMLALLGRGKCTINTLAAVTFTLKAAAELASRFQTELEKEVHRECQPETKKRLVFALQNLEQCYIGTIHSFCAKLLRERPVEARLDPDFREMDDNEEAAFRNKCWHGFLAQEKKQEISIFGELAAVGLTPADLCDAFETLCLFPEVKPVEGSKSRPDFNRFRVLLEEFLENANKTIPSQIPEKGFDGLQKLMRRCLLRQRNLDFGDNTVLMDTLVLMDREPRVTLNRWSAAEIAKDFQGEYEYFRKQVVCSAVREWFEYRHSFVLKFLRRAVKYYKDFRQKHSRVNFQDLLLSTAEMLRENPEVRRYFRQRCTHILVDEFQDTDPIQAEMLFYLTGTDTEEDNWQKLVPVPGSLFLVGDPKQSIYRFRRADIASYDLVKDLIGKSGGEILRLTENFRSLPYLCNWNNRLFQEIFPAELSHYQAQFVPLEPFRTGEEGLSGIYRINLPKIKRNNEKRMAAVDAEAIAGWIKKTCGSKARLLVKEDDKEVLRQPKPKDFLILFRYKKNMGVYARALEEEGLPFEITGGKGFETAREIQEIVNLVKALMFPDNQVLTVAVLRGIFFGISDEELVKYKFQGGKFSFFSASTQISGKDEDKALSALLTMRKWWEWTQKYPASSTLEKILESTGLIYYLISSNMESSRVGNLFKLLEILRVREREENVSFYNLVEFLEEVVSDHEVEESSLIPDREDAVRLMNLHKAKGLEAPVVILAHPVGRRATPPDLFIDRTESREPRGYFRLVQRTGYQSRIISQPVGWEGKEAEETLYQDAEEHRLMYVASTRAKNLLVISTYEENLSSKSAWRAIAEKLREYNGNVLPELELSEKYEKVVKEKIEISKAEVETARKEIREKIANIKTPGYLLETVTSLAKAEADTPPWKEGGRGLRWGRIVHCVLDVLGKQPEVEIEPVLDNALAVEEWDPIEKSILLRLIRGICASEFWQRAMAAEVKYFEVPFSLQVADDKPGAGKESPPMILSGTIDLVFKEIDGWVIADYKTDETGDNLDDFVNYYTPQVRLYTRFWENITKEKVKETGLFFTSINQWIRIDT